MSRREPESVSAPNDWNRKIIEEFRANGGKVGGMFKGANLLLLHHTGAKTGTERVSPLAYQRVGNAYAVFGSKGGAPTHPDWYYNVRANPRAKAEIDADTIEVTARVAEGEERAEIWARQTANIPQFAEYERRAHREIPVVILEAIDES
jgi:deazaflavin-dependent oxidoreductase (nitroreductase family)